MKSILLSSVGMMCLAVCQAQANVIVTGSEILPNAALIFAPLPDLGATGFGTDNKDHYTGSTLDGRSPFDGVTGYTDSFFSYVTGGGSATFSKATNSTFVTGGDTFSFILGSPDLYNSLKFSNGDSVSGKQLVDAFTALNTGGSAGTGYYVATVSGLTDYSSVTFSSAQNSIEFATYVVAAVPLPASLPLFGGALLGMGLIAYAKKRAVQGDEA